MNEEVKRIVDALKYLANSKSPAMGLRLPPKWIIDEDIYLEDLTGMAADLLENLSAENERLKARCEAAERDMKLIADTMDADNETLPCVLCAKNNERCDVSDTCFEWRGPQNGGNEDEQD